MSDSEDDYREDEHGAVYWVGEERHFEPTAAIAAMFKDDGDFLFVAAGKVDDHHGQGIKPCACLFLVCSDLFHWGYADLEPIPHDQIEPLYLAWVSDPGRGPSIWCCKRRNMQPQTPIKRRWVEDGTWNDELEALPENPDAQRYREHANQLSAIADRENQRLPTPRQTGTRSKPITRPPGDGTPTAPDTPHSNQPESD